MKTNIAIVSLALLLAVYSLFDSKASVHRNERKAEGTSSFKQDEVKLFWQWSSEQSHAFLVEKLMVDPERADRIMKLEIQSKIKALSLKSPSERETIKRETAETLRLELGESNYMEFLRLKMSLVQSLPRHFDPNSDAPTL
jgi:hypothetical protein